MVEQGYPAKAGAAVAGREAEPTATPAHPETNLRRGPEEAMVAAADAGEQEAAAAGRAVPASLWWHSTLS
jgi:hypothetical protein